MKHYPSNTYIINKYIFMNRNSRGPMPSSGHKAISIRENGKFVVTITVDGIGKYFASSTNIWDAKKLRRVGAIKMLGKKRAKELGYIR